MATITLSVDERTRKKMKEFDEINWSAFIRKQIERKTREIEDLEVLREQTRKEKSIETFAVNLQRTSRSGRLEELRKKGLV
jgi:predicted CopG family antitoxin